MSRFSEAKKKIHWLTSRDTAMRQRTDNSRTAGFTLIEILVALFIFSVVSLLMTTALHSLLRSQESVEKSAERFAALQTALLLLSRDIEQSIDRSASVPAGIAGAFNGAPDRLTLTHTGLVNPDAQLQRPTLQRTQYQF